MGALRDKMSHDAAFAVTVDGDKTRIVGHGAVINATFDQAGKRLQVDIVNNAAIMRLATIELRLREALVVSSDNL